MKKILFTLLFLTTYAKIFACSCDIPKPAIEFYTSKYVFVGKVTSKTYSKDSLTYTVNFEIEKHFKKGNNPKNLEFTFKSEGEYTGTFSSCDWNVNKEEKWLVFAYYHKNKLTFSYFCSNSKPIREESISKNMLKVLNNGNKFNLKKYTLTSLDGNFDSPEPTINIDSIIKLYPKVGNKKSYEIVVLDINETGEATKVNLYPKGKERELKVIDTIFNLNKFKNKEYRKPKNEFSKTVLDICKQIKTWQPQTLKATNEPVKFRVWIKFYLDKKGQLVYEI